MALDGPGLNAWFDRLPRTSFDVGSHRVPAFRSLGVVGFHVAVVVAVLTSLRTGLPLASALGLSAAAGLSFFAWAYLRRSITGHESLVLIEYVWVAYAAVAGFAWASGGGLAPAVDVYSVAVAPFLAFGRMGCTVVGCCHGPPSPVGLRYGPDHALPPRLTGRRLFPVQPIEAVALLLIGTIGFLLAPRAAGTATVWFLASYAILRFGCERLRGDVRPAVFRVPVAQTMCVLQLGAAIVASEAWLVPGRPGRATAVGLTTIAVAGVVALVLVASRRRNPLVRAEHLDEVWTLVTQPIAPTAPSPVVSHSSAGMTIAVSRDQHLRHVSLSHPDYDTMPVALALGCEAATRLRGVTHALLQDSDDTDTHSPGIDAAPVADRRHAGSPMSQAELASYFTHSETAIFPESRLGRDN